MRSRIVLIFLGFTLLFIGLISRSVYLQAMPDHKLTKLEARQYTKTVTKDSHRGGIFDRSGKELAVTISTFSLFADPKIIEKRSQVARKVSRYLKISFSKVKKLLENPKHRFKWIKRHLSKAQKEEIASWKIRGLAFIEESKRIYPNDELLKPVLGFMSRDGRGLEGLELAQNSVLKGSSREVKVQRDARGRPLVVDVRDFFKQPDGSDIYLTIDSEFQFVLEHELNATVNQFDAASAMGVVLNAQTSEILAIANIQGVAEKGVRRNRVVTDFFEPGSTVKTIIAAGAIREGLAMPNTVYDCGDGKLKIGRRTIREADRSHAFKNLTLSEILAHSSNVGITKVAFQLGAKRTRKVLEDFGFGQKTNVDLPGEVGGILSELPWRKHQLSNISFGHAMAATSLQVANAYAAIANGGILRQPQIIKRKVHPVTGEKLYNVHQGRRVMTVEQAELMKFMLMGATSTDGTGWRARVPGFPVAGKTGTAQKVNPNGRGYLKGSYVSSFAGFIPVRNPKYVIYIQVDDPKEEYYGSTVAAPVFAKVAKFAMRKSGDVPVILSDSNLIKKLGKNTTKNQQFESAKQVDFLRRVKEDLISDKEGTAPNYLGLSLRQVYKRSSNRGIKIKVKGKGRVVRTWPDPGDKLGKNTKMRVLLKESL